MSAPASSSAGLPEGARIVLATHNAGKVRELRQLLAGAVPGLDVEAAVVDAGAVGAPDVVEDGVTFAQNALKKARAVAAHTGLIAVADDSGLAVDVLHGAPGIFSARAIHVEHVEHGRLPGTLLREPVGDGGFGYDPILRPEGRDVSTAQLSPEDKNAISHRGHAFRALLPYLVDALDARP